MSIRNLVSQDLSLYDQITAATWNSLGSIVGGSVDSVQSANANIAVSGVPVEGQPGQFAGAVTVALNNDVAVTNLTTAGLTAGGTAYPSTVGAAGTVLTSNGALPATWNEPSGLQTVTAGSNIVVTPAGNAVTVATANTLSVATVNATGNVTGGELIVANTGATQYSLPAAASPTSGWLLQCNAPGAACTWVDPGNAAPITDTVTLTFATPVADPSRITAWPAAPITVKLFKAPGSTTGSPVTCLLDFSALNAAQCATSAASAYPLASTTAIPTDFRPAAATGGGVGIQVTSDITFAFHVGGDATGTYELIIVYVDSNGIMYLVRSQVEGAPATWGAGAMIYPPAQPFGSTMVIPTGTTPGKATITWMADA